MIQDIAPHKLYNSYQPQAKAQDKDKIMVIRGGEILIKGTEAVDYPTLEEMKAKGVSPEDLTYLFTVDEQRFFLYGVEGQSLAKETAEKKAALEGEGLRFIDLRALREELTGPMEMVFAAYTGKHLSDWYRDNTFCGRCGTVTEHSKTERARVCPQCGYTCYPRIMPAVIVGVTNGDRILITRYNRGFAHNALIAGFTEIGETLEETVEREVMEEAGVKVKNIRYYKSQPWGSANDLLAGFYCDVDGDDTIRRDDNELKYAEWTKREDIVLQPDSLSLTNEMMLMFKEGKE